MNNSIIYEKFSLSTETAFLNDFLEYDLYFRKSLLLCSYFVLNGENWFLCSNLDDCEIAVGMWNPPRHIYMKSDLSYLDVIEIVSLSLNAPVEGKRLYEAGMLYICIVYFCHR